jgi:hypothetical protein
MMAALGTLLTGLEQTGFDPFVGRKLYSLAREAGSVEPAVSAESYHLIAVSVDAANRRRGELKLQIAAPGTTRKQSPTRRFSP